MAKILIMKTRKPSPLDTKSNVLQKVQRAKSMPSIRNAVKVASNPLKKKA